MPASLLQLSEKRSSKMNLIYKTTIIITLSTALSACQSVSNEINYLTGDSGCKKSYQEIEKSEPNTSTLASPASQTPIIKRSTDTSFDTLALVFQAIGNGYMLQGICNFQGTGSESNFTSIQAKRVKADAAFSSAKYIGTQYIVGPEGGGSRRVYEWTEYFFYKVDETNSLKFKYYVATNGTGFITAELSDDERSIYKRNAGAIVKHVVNRSPAFYSELFPNDIIIGINNKEVKSSSELKNIIRDEITRSIQQSSDASKTSGADILISILKDDSIKKQTILLKILRNGSEMSLSIPFLSNYEPEKFF